MITKIETKTKTGKQYGGFGAILAWLVIVQKDHFSPLQHYDILAMFAFSIMLLTIYLVYRVSKIIKTPKLRK